MTKLLVFSDSHGCAGHMLRAIEAEAPDGIVFLGDGERDLHEVMRRFPNLPVKSVRGNVDGQSAAPLLLRDTIEGKRVFAVHGHEYNVKYGGGIQRLCYAAMEADADIVLFGHTHAPYSDRYLGMDILNPGSIGSNARPTYGVVTIADGAVATRIKAAPQAEPDGRRRE